MRAGEDVWGSSCSRGMDSAPVEAPAWATEGLHSCDDFALEGGDVLVASEDRAGLHKTKIQGMRMKVQKSSVRHTCLIAVRFEKA